MAVVLLGHSGDRTPPRPIRWFTVAVEGDGAAEKTLIVDDDDAMRVLLRTAIQLDGRFEIVDEADDGMKAVALAATHLPAVVLLDAAMPELNGIEAIPAILAVSKASRVFVYSAYVSDRAEQLAVAYGAAGVVSKTVPIRKLLDIVAASRSG